MTLWQFGFYWIEYFGGNLSYFMFSYCINLPYYIKMDNFLDIKYTMREVQGVQFGHSTKNIKSQVKD